MLPPGRTMLLRRLKGTTDTPSQAQSGLLHRSRPRRERQRGYSWDAVWVERSEQLIEEGILLSSRQASDHYTARLLGVLGELSKRAAADEPCQAARSGMANNERD